MKKLLFASLIALPLTTHALTWKIFGPCSDKPLYEGAYQADLNKSIGEISIEIFEKNKIAYVGVPAGFNSINNSPTGLDALEVVSDTEMRAYGWCYLVNNKMPVEMPDQVKPKSQDDKLVWFYGYGTNKDNVWIEYCSPGYWVKPDQFCKKP